MLKEILKKIKSTESTLSTFFGIIVVLIVGVLILRYFQGIDKKISLPNNETEVEEKSLSLTEDVSEKLPTVHKVKTGENLWQIAVKYYNSGYNWIDIAKENNLANPGLLITDSELKIPDVKRRIPVAESIKSINPISEETYTVIKGDNLWSIALRAYGDGYRWAEIAKANNLSNPNIIHPGNVLSLPR